METREIKFEKTNLVILPIAIEIIEQTRYISFVLIHLELYISNGSGSGHYSLDTNHLIN